ncbi:hypothetical protein ABIB25_002806 [Nakamurella sp. UYEF19]|uniref:DUF885 family protein n=1 Tax=Nakamurella sp. UYEF19 TaxID=1756392 RepID=UPI0033919F5D
MPDQPADAVAALAAGSAALEELGSRIWSWQIVHQPRNRDDIPRVERPAGWLPDFCAATVASIRDQRSAFADELAALDVGEDVSDLVDRRLLISLLARVEWELDVVRSWQRQPRFYLDQSIGTVFDALLRPGVDAERIREVVRLFSAAPGILATGRENLTGHAFAECAALALDELTDIEKRCAAVGAALAQIYPELGTAVTEAAGAAAAALVTFREWLVEQHPSMTPWVPVGAVAYQQFLRDVAVMPFTPEQLLAIGSAELDRAIALEHLERNRNRVAGRPPAPMPADIEAQVALEDRQEAEVRQFHVERGLLSQPESLGRYLFAKMPAYLEPFGFLGVCDDLTSATRLDENSVKYTPAPGPDLPYFYAANAVDPRAGIVHEGAHYQQLALAWRHPRMLRRHFYDSGANEGVAFYNEEMTLAAGLFDDAPDTRVILYNFMRLRALRVKVDVGLATGTLSIAEAARYLGTEVPMDAATAAQEAADFAEGPGQAISYQIGKTQILSLIADAARQRPGQDVDIQQLHDYLWRNGNVPIALCRWEFLGLTDQLAQIGVVLPGQQPPTS